MMDWEKEWYKFLDIVNDVESGGDTVDLTAFVKRLILENHRLQSLRPCCENGEVWVDSRQFTSGFDYGNDADSHSLAGSFPKMGKAICPHCHGANGLKSINERQAEIIKELHLTLDAKNENLDKLAESYGRLINDYKELKWMYDGLCK